MVGGLLEAIKSIETIRFAYDCYYTLCECDNWIATCIFF